MSDPHAEQPNIRRLDCEDCQASPDSGDIRTLAIGTAGTTETWHTRECPAYTIQQILGEASAQKAKEQQARAEEAFLAAYRRLREATQTLPADDAAAPFAAALLELAQAQADDTSHSVALPTWTKILNRHIPRPH